MKVNHVKCVVKKKSCISLNKNTQHHYKINRLWWAAAMGEEKC